jgi:hypothetical protein
LAEVDAFFFASDILAFSAWLIVSFQSTDFQAGSPGI